jgi:hypothetical protein
MTLERKKINLIQQIAASSQEDFINALDELAQRFTTPKYSIDLSRHTNIKTHVDIDSIKKERPPIDFDMNQFIEEANSLEWNKSIDELLIELDS